jgi:hypothetical protein
MNLREVGWEGVDWHHGRCELYFRCFEVLTVFIKAKKLTATLTLNFRESLSSEKIHLWVYMNICMKVVSRDT